MKLPLLLLLPLSLLSTACEKETEADALPKATQEGQHTFGCLVDGKAFVPKTAQATSITRRAPLEAYIYRTDLLVSAMGGGYVEFALRNAFKPGTYTLGETSSGSYGSHAVSGARYDTNLDYPGTVTLTRIDTVAKIAAGTFQFTASDYRSGKTITITQGRFDVRLK
ncbi:DUF6252 family protein [Hymenobacter elongatus]|uniref:Uncharacterized protein n=1 Tax=Hymenobacter elongatus TaxID=877208 RepID=A0A4Z0PMP8_9BACT|nr:DUF6252 family protein [Hymenobacter elongatus]TGE17845.1 hypothetical protein E5J99_06555 [Hymenobacter elongatus]